MSMHTESKAFDEHVDIVVVGSGFAGLAAAIEAKKGSVHIRP